jgi:hypothetical protein
LAMRCVLSLGFGAVPLLGYYVVPFFGYCVEGPWWAAADTAASNLYILICGWIRLAELRFRSTG